MSAQAAACAILWRCYSSPHRTEIYTESSNLVYSLSSHRVRLSHTNERPMVFARACVCVCSCMRWAERFRRWEMCARVTGTEIEAVPAQMAAMILLTKILRNEISKIVLCVWFGLILLLVSSQRVSPLFSMYSATTQRIDKRQKLLLAALTLPVVSRIQRRVRFFFCFFLSLSLSHSDSLASISSSKIKHLQLAQ